MAVAGTRHNSDRRVIRTKKAIKSALLALMEEKDISEITISELTRRAGINRRTFYTHYRGISDIIDEIEGDMVKSLGDVMLKIDVTNIRQSAYNVFIELDEVVSAEFDYYFRRVRMDMRGVFVTRLKGVVNELSHKLSEENAGYLDSAAANSVSAYIVGGFFNSFLEWRADSTRVSLEKAARMISVITENCVKGLKGN